MPRATQGLGALAPVLLFGCLHPPVLWSPDGRWLSYTQTVRPVSETVEPGWIFGESAGAEAGPAHRSIVAYRIWATRAETGQSVLLEESAGPLTSPGWSPKGTALAYGRLVPLDGGKSRFEVVVQDAPDRRRVLLSLPLDGPRPEATDLPAASVVWGPDGRHLAVPTPRPPGLAVIRVEDGRVVRQIPGAYLASWSPDGARLAFFRRGETEGLYVLDLRAAEPRLLLEVQEPGGLPAPAWSPDGQSVTVVRRMLAPDGQLQAQLDRVRVENGQVEPVLRSIFYGQQPLPHDRALLGASFAIDREDLFTIANVEGPESMIIWSKLREPNPVVMKQFNPIDLAVPIGAVSASPAGGLLALRVGTPGLLSTPALCEPQPGLVPEKFTAIIPDDAARAEWIATILRATRDLIHLGYPAPGSPDDSPIERPTLLPAPGEPPRVPLLDRRIRKMAEIGRKLCERPTGAPAPDEGCQALLGESRLFFDYLTGDYAAALTDLEAFEPRAESADRRLRLLGLRAQIYLGQKDFERARGTIDYLRTLGDAPAHPIEETPTGPVLTVAPDPLAGWARHLAERAEALKSSRPDEESDEDAAAHFNPDAPGADEPAFPLMPPGPR